MRYYIIGNKDSKTTEYDYAEHWLKLNNNIVINPSKISIDGISDKELVQVKIQLLSLADAVFVLDKSCNSYELEYAKALGKKVKYLSKQWKLRKKENQDNYMEDNV